MSAAISIVHVIQRLRDARELVAHGWPSIAVALAAHPISTAQARLQEAEAARHTDGQAHPWVQVLTDALALVDEAREMWGTTADAMPPMTHDLAPCGRELRMHLPDARRCAEMGLAWEDPGGLTRPQGLCVVHLAVCLAEWRAEEERLEQRSRQARAELEQERRHNSQVAARAIWGGQTRRAPEPVKEMRSLRDLANVSAAFSDWGDEEES